MSRGTPWTEAEKQVLFDHYEKRPTAELMPLLPGRTLKQIWSYANYLGLRTGRPRYCTYASAAGHSAKSAPSRPPMRPAPESSAAIQARIERTRQQILRELGRI